MKRIDKVFGQCMMAIIIDVHVFNQDPEISNSVDLILGQDRIDLVVKNYCGIQIDFNSITIEELHPCNLRNFLNVLIEQK